MDSPSPEPEPGKGRAVRGMFADIAPRYDLLNRLLSVGLDRRWRAALVAALADLPPDERVLDLCTGTGDVALELSGKLRHLRVHAGDFCEPMVALAPAKTPARQEGPRYHVADALALPFEAGRFAGLTVAFGLRNIEDPAAALREMARVLSTDGRLLILEFGRPHNRVFRAIYKFYVFHILPLIGRIVSGSSYAYRYLPESVWAFYGSAELSALIEEAGFDAVQARPFLNGAVVLHSARRRNS